MKIYSLLLQKCFDGNVNMAKFNFGSNLFLETVFDTFPLLAETNQEPDALSKHCTIGWVETHEASNADHHHPLSSIKDIIGELLIVKIDPAHFLCIQVTHREMMMMMMTAVVTIHDICHNFLHGQHFGRTLSPHRKCVNCDKTGFATKQRKLQQNRFCDKTA